MNNKGHHAFEQSDPYLEQQQTLNRKFKQFLHSSHSIQSLPSLPSHKFTPQQLQQIQQRFNQLCDNQEQMTYQQFRRGLGLLGRQDSFVCRLFNLIDDDADGMISQDNYLKYLGVILKGNQLEKARFGWMILTENKGDIDFKDFMELFQEISVVWNALTGEVVVPKKKYVQQLFNTFDVDQDQTITFSDYRLFFNEHLQFSGWFQYFNGIQHDQEISRNQLQKVRKRLRSKLQIQGFQQTIEGPEQLKMAIQDYQISIQKKLVALTSGMRETANEIRQKRQLIMTGQKKDSQSQQEQSIYNVSYHSTTSQTVHTAVDQPSLFSIKSFYKYNHEHIMNSPSPISKIQQRKQLLLRQTSSTLNHQITRELNSYLESTYKMMNMCQVYRGLKEKQRRYSPTKIKQMRVKLNLVDKEVKQDGGNKEENKKKKMTVYFGHQNWNMVVNIMVGLRKSIRALTHVPELKQSHFTEQHEFYLGNKAFLSGRGPQALKNMQSFLFIEMAPSVFQKLRLQYGISNNEYQRSVGPEGLINQLLTGDLTALNEKCSTGKSGAFFYLTSDNKIFLKTLPKHQFIFYTKIIQNYYKHMTDYPNTLIVRIFGLYKLKIYQNKQKIDTVYFISMENIFYKVKADSQCHITQVYDLKGSLYGRAGSDGGQLKDKDWLERKKKIQLPQQFGNVFKEQITTDSRFFKKNNINDYSLMVAIVKFQGQLTSQKESNLFKRVKGGIYGREKGLLYVLSIIDILTVFETRKNLQYLFKSTFLSKDVSCIPPSDYCIRFREFIHSSIN